MRCGAMYVTMGMLLGTVGTFGCTGLCIDDAFAVERIWHIQDSHGQILALAFRYESSTCRTSEVALYVIRGMLAGTGGTFVYSGLAPDDVSDELVYTPTNQIHYLISWCINQMHCPNAGTKLTWGICEQGRWGCSGTRGWH